MTAEFRNYIKRRMAGESEEALFQERLRRYLEHVSSALLDSAQTIETITSTCFSELQNERDHFFREERGKLQEMLGQARALENSCQSLQKAAEKGKEILGEQEKIRDLLDIYLKELAEDAESKVVVQDPHTGRQVRNMGSVAAAQIYYGNHS